MQHYTHQVVPNVMFNPGHFQLHPQMTPPPSPHSAMVSGGTHFPYYQSSNTAFLPGSPDSRRSSSSPSQASQWDHHSTSSTTSDARAITSKASISALEVLGRPPSPARFLVLNNVPQGASNPELKTAFTNFGDLAWFCTRWLKSNGAVVLAFFSAHQCADAHNTVGQLVGQGRVLFQEHLQYQWGPLTSLCVRASHIQSVDQEYLGQVEASVLIVAEAFVNGAVLRDVLSKFGELYSFEPLDVDGLRYACEYVDSRHANQAVLELHNKPTVLTVPLKVHLIVQPPAPTPLPIAPILPLEPFPVHQIYEAPPQFPYAPTGQMMTLPLTPVTPQRSMFPQLPVVEVKSRQRPSAKGKVIPKRERTRHETLHSPIPDTPAAAPAISVPPRIRRYSTGCVSIPGDTTVVAAKKSKNSLPQTGKVEEPPVVPRTKIKETGDGLCVLEKKVSAARTQEDIAPQLTSLSPSKRSYRRQPADQEDDERVVYTPPVSSNRSTVKGFFDNLRHGTGTANVGLPPRLRQLPRPDPPTRRISLNLQTPTHLAPLSTRISNAYQHPHARDTASASPRNVVDLDRIAQGRDTRTTIMIKNVPSRMTHADMERFISADCEREFDFLYLRMDFVTGNNVGYAFVNFMEVSSLLRFLQRNLNTRWNMYSSDKIMLAAYATYQGKAALVTKFQNSSILDRDESVQPHIYYSSGENRGLPEPFPAPNDTARKARSLAAANEHGLYSRMELHRRQQLGGQALKSRSSLPHIAPVSFPSLDKSFTGLKPVGEETIFGPNRLC